MKKKKQKSGKGTPPGSVYIVQPTIFLHTVDPLPSTKKDDSRAFHGNVLYAALEDDCRFEQLDDCWRSTYAAVCVLYCIYAPTKKTVCLSQKTYLSKNQVIQICFHHCYPAIQLSTPPPFTHPNDHPITSQHAPEFVPQLSQASIVLLGSPQEDTQAPWWRKSPYLEFNRKDISLTQKKDMICFKLLHKLLHPSVVPLVLANKVFLGGENPALQCLPKQN